MLSKPTRGANQILQRYLKSLQQDNNTAVKRPGAKELLEKVFPALRKLFRITKLPTTLNEVESKYIVRVPWPKAIYSYHALMDTVRNFGTSDNNPYSEECLEEYKTMSTTFAGGTTYDFVKSSVRNLRAMKKSAALPSMGKKREHLADAIEYNVEVVKPANSINKCFAALLGYRAQKQTEPGTTPDVRQIWMTPEHIWVLECEAADSAIDNTISESQKLDAQIQVRYVDRKSIHTWMLKYAGQVTEWVNLDATKYDNDVQVCELAYAWKTIAPNYEFRDLIAQYGSTCAVLTPEGLITRLGGICSGSKGTNWIDGFTNVHDIIDVLVHLNLFRFVVCILVNGDDITIGFSTKLTKDNIVKIDNLSRRTLNPDKCIKWPDAIWNSKDYICVKFITRPVFRALNSLIFKERESNAIVGSSVYVAIARTQILSDVEEHPIGDQFAKLVAKYEEFSIHQAVDDPRWNDALDYYIDTHDYMGTVNRAEFEKKLLSSKYAELTA
jgi:hypothetical protein